MSYTYNPIYSHFKGDDVTRCELIERTVVEIIQNSPMPDADRVWSKVFELKHSSAVTQLGRILAQKRGLNPELAAIMCALHDVYVFTTGRASDHAHLGGPIAREILEKTGKFTEAEIDQIVAGVYHHSDKHIESKDPYVELVKDADVLDCGLYDNVHDAYLYEKSHDNCVKYFGRIQKVRAELGLPKDEQWDIFEYIAKGKEYEANRKK